MINFESYLLLVISYWRKGIMSIFDFAPPDLLGNEEASRTRALIRI
jgi:hypothetical protein